MNWTRVTVESPLGAPTRDGIEANRIYAKKAVLDCLRRGEAPYASHLFFDQPGLLDDLSHDERELGISIGLAWSMVAEKCVVYADKGITPGMKRGIAIAESRGIPVEIRYLDRV